MRTVEHSTHGLAGNKPSLCPANSANPLSKARTRDNAKGNHGTPATKRR